VRLNDGRDGRADMPIAWTDVYIDPAYTDFGDMVRASPDTLVSTTDRVALRAADCRDRAGRKRVDPRRRNRGEGAEARTGCVGIENRPALSGRRRADLRGYGDGASGGQLFSVDAIEAFHFVGECCFGRGAAFASSVWVALPHGRFNRSMQQLDGIVQPV